MYCRALYPVSLVHQAGPGVSYRGRREGLVVPIRKYFNLLGSRCAGDAFTPSPVIA